MDIQLKPEVDSTNQDILSNRTEIEKIVKDHFKKYFHKKL